MKIYNYKNSKNIFFVLSVTLFLLSACTEEMKDPCSGNNNIEINVEGINVETCEGTTQEYPAVEAQVMIIHYNDDRSDADTLINRNLDSSGKLNYMIPNSQCGINNIKLVAENQSFYYEDEIDFMCCDTSYVFKFERNCAETNESEVSCESFNTKIDLELTNQYGGCLIVGAEKTDIRWNSTSIQTDDEITVDVTSVAELSGFLYANISPQPDENGEVQLNGNNELNISFFVETDEITPRETTSLILPTYCIDGSGNEHMGEIEINVTTEICEDACVCPFSNNGDVNKTVDYSAYPVSVGTTINYDNQNIFTIEEGMLDSECYLIITDIIRFNSTSDAAAFSSNHDWRISNHDELLGAQIRLNDRFNMSAEFKPEVFGERIDTFEIIVDVYNRVDEVKESCSFIVEYKGAGCENYCPNLVMKNNNEAELISTGSKVTMNDTISFGNDVLSQQLTGYVNTSCENLSETNAKILQYELLIDPQLLSSMCGSLTIDIEQSGSDSDYFNTWFNTISNTTTVYSGFSGEPVSMGIMFVPPSVSDYLDGEENPVYSSDFTIRAYNSDGFECVQVIHVDAKAEQISSKYSDINTLLTFSQVSDIKSEPSLKVFSIPQTLSSSGIERLSMSDDIVEIGGYLYPDQNYIGDASFYFDVDYPNDINNTVQEPELYLMNTSGNDFSSITRYPVANYATSDNFQDDIENLVKKVFDTDGFIFDGHNFSFDDNDGLMWNNSLEKEDFVGSRNGISLSQGDVFIIWDPQTNRVIPDTPGVYGGYCNVAFIYISGVMTGRETDNGDHLGSVKFMVAYPLSIVK